MRPWHVKRLFRLPNRTRDEIRRDVSDEFAFHLDMRADELMREGMSPADARAQALKEFGTVDSSAHTLAQLGDTVERRRRIGHFAAELLAGRRGSAFACWPAAPASPSSPSSRSRSASAPTPPSTACSTRCCCGRCPIPSRTA